MSTITTINAADQITASRTVINTNFSNLNTDKIETSAIDTDTALTANSDAKIPSQKAVKAFVEAQGFGNASTTGKGIVEEATSAEIAAGTTTGATGARLFVNPGNLTVLTTCIPLPVVSGLATTNLGFTDLVTASVALINIPGRITVNKISVVSGSVTTPDTVDITLYSEDGATQILSVTTPSIAANGTLYSATVSTVSIAPGNYWVLVNANTGTPNFQLTCWSQSSPFITTLFGGGVGSEPILSGTLVITAGTPPATITPTGITAANSKGIVFRLDN